MAGLDSLTNSYIHWANKVITENKIKGVVLRKDLDSLKKSVDFFLCRVALDEKQRNKAEKYKKIFEGFDVVNESFSSRIMDVLVKIFDTTSPAPKPVVEFSDSNIAIICKNVIKKIYKDYRKVEKNLPRIFRADYYNKINDARIEKMIYDKKFPSEHRLPDFSIPLDVPVRFSASVLWRILVMPVQTIMKMIGVSISGVATGFYELFWSVLSMCKLVLSKTHSKEKADQIIEQAVEEAEKECKEEELAQGAEDAKREEVHPM